MALNVNSYVKETSFACQAGEAITAGMWVKATGSTEAGATSKLYDDVTVSMANAGGDEDSAVGIALNTAASGGPVTVATQGIFKVQIDSNNGAVTVGSSVQVGDQGTAAVKVELHDVADGANPVGLALSPANTDDEYIWLLLTMGGPSIT